MNTYMNGERRLHAYRRTGVGTVEDRVGKLSFCNLAVKAGSDQSPPRVLDLGGNPAEEQGTCDGPPVSPPRLFIGCNGGDQ